MLSDKIKTYNYSILVVDDDKELVLEMEDILKERGYKVFSSFCGDDAINILKREKIDILVIDYFMNGINGEETVLKIREFNSEIVIILQTGYAGDRPGIDILEKLNIQGYHDKVDGADKFLIWIMSATRMVQQIKEIKKMIKEINQAHETLKTMKDDQTWLIEQVRLASLGRKIGSIFHDMATPLLSIENSVKAIKECVNLGEYPTGQQVTEIKKVIELKCESIEKRVNYIKDMKSMVVEQSKNEKINRWEYFTVGKLLEKVKFFATEDLKSYNTELVIDNCVSEDVKIYGREVSLVQVLNNLILNSSQAYGKGGKVELSILQNNDYIEFTVKDNASGIPQDIQNVLLNEMVTTKNKNGSGIGIYSSYLIVKDYFKGEMGFKSQEKVGTTFYVRIPRK